MYLNDCKFPEVKLCTYWKTTDHVNESFYVNCTLKTGFHFICFTCISLPEQGNILPEMGCDSLSGLNQGLQASLRCSHTHKLNAP